MGKVGCFASKINTCFGGSYQLMLYLILGFICKLQCPIMLRRIQTMISTSVLHWY
ncbi:hypothetical protein Nepgr_029189 [Nepenthes gracilis]|uniref:Uncharacterized protein n=1 Tax=Nepenthes gracilis TaxID=150966 RepID=A0AAD3Y5A9_NEPGR|nr:hypothetical protein Nepgr_029189 [Nepenthes gracilis]